MKLAEIKNRLKKGQSIHEIVNADLNLIGNDDETDSVEDVKSNATTDNFVKQTRQRGGVDRTNALFSIDLMNTVIEEDSVEEGMLDLRNSNLTNTLMQQYPIVFKNLEVLLDSMHRADINPDVKTLIVHLIIQD